MGDLSQLLEAASDFSHYPGVQSDDSARDFLNRFPLTLIINALQTNVDVPDLENTLVACLDKLFNTKLGASLIPQYMPFVQVGLQAESQAVRSLSCKTVSRLLENVDNDDKVAASVRLIKDFNIYPLLLDCIINGDEQVAAVAADAITKLASFPEGMEIIFPSGKVGETDLELIASQCSSLGRVRVLALVVKLFSVSRSAASTVYSLNLLKLLEAELRNADDTLVTLSVLELLYELAAIEHSTEFLSKTSLIELLSSIISNNSVESILRSRAMMICGRLVPKDIIHSFTNEPCVKAVIASIDGRLQSLDPSDIDECETALESLGHIGSSTQGATLLLSGSSPAARHVIDAAFERQGPQGHGKQLAALHALGNISGETRSKNNIILNAEAEENLRRLIYETATRSSKLTPSGLFLSVLQQDAEIRLAVYRVISGLVARPWCLMEICSKDDIINKVTNPTVETTKIGMEARYNCCKAIYQTLTLSDSVSAFTDIYAKLEKAVRMGPYLVKSHGEPQPVVETAERF
ncbi:26S proteasome non-ATPase regulatory subunit 5 [Vigna unguiculata]|uniref:26S proteasome non-ATPase regulatory subunit 5 n=1 Tax=Vigna unguiculata TaxID=3917 RepID=A0A4D6LCW5_VIGUN|nr:26S proteasome non-ATPase regulatory subunit 5 [Vigna unguiculata]